MRSPIRRFEEWCETICDEVEAEEEAEKKGLTHLAYHNLTRERRRESKAEKLFFSLFAVGWWIGDFHRSNVRCWLRDFPPFQALRDADSGLADFHDDIDGSVGSNKP